MQDQFLNRMEFKTPSDYVNVLLEVDGKQSQLISVEGGITVRQLRLVLLVSRFWIHL